MITDEELSQLPVDPELAFVQFEKIVRERLQIEERNAARGEYDPDPYRLEYMNKVAAAAKVYQIDTLSQLEVPNDATKKLDGDLQRFVRDVDHVTIQIRIHLARSDRTGSVALDDMSKSKIHHFIQQIREIIGKAELPDDKRDALYEKLSRFAKEVDKARTALQTGMVIYIAVCDGIGKGFTKLEPARKWIDSIAGVLGLAKDGEDHADHRLPPPAERKRLEPPSQRRLPKPQTEIDDDIPF
ncbi:hypothetical protein [Methylocapsa sp. S129]|uniref:hypothetical protein n=1 Tax=Methylocapsa sp. S129 TaxID=1641869 RepID=UPI00131DDA4C|nr:hypothetical protein [Methylocapsa sp. S129]